MKRILTFLCSFILITAIQAQTSTSARVYEIFQDNCVTCHNNDDPAAGLDLEGSGANPALEVYNNLVDVTPANAQAAAQGYAYIYPGRTDKSFLFRKVNQGLDPLIDLHADAGLPMPQYGDPLADVEKELIRQWILFGAPLSGEVVSEDLLVDYYENGMGVASFPTPPPAPDPSEGFQIKMGPFFLEPGGNAGDELEFFTKYETDLTEDLEVNRIEVLISPYSHHFIVYDFDNPSYADNVNGGYRPEAYHQGIGLVAAVQEQTDLSLPQGTAWKWEAGKVLDLNSHYINYSAAEVYQAEAYLNVYTQPSGTAAQEMHTELISNFDIPIPNNGDLITHDDIINENLGEVFVWGVMGHTHQYGVGYKVYERENFLQGDLIYDASCPQGVPGCVSPYYDYQHIPMRYYEPLMPIMMNNNNGLVHEASWINDGPFPVNFGPTSDDEMMVVIIMFTLDSTGVVINDLKETPIPLEGVRVYPNPADDHVLFQIPSGTGPVNIRILDALGQERHRVDRFTDLQYVFYRENLTDGIYFYRIEDTAGRVAMGKVILR